MLRAIPILLSHSLAQATTCADVLQTTPGRGNARDSYSILPVLMQKADTVAGQKALVHHSSMGFFAIRQGVWKLVEKRGSRGFSEPSTVEPAPSESLGQLFDLETDPGENTNLTTSFRKR